MNTVRVLNDWHAGRVCLQICEGPRSVTWVDITVNDTRALREQLGEAIAEHAYLDASLEIDSRQWAQQTNQDDGI